jgi:hypothetical protein
MAVEMPVEGDDDIAASSRGFVRDIGRMRSLVLGDRDLRACVAAAVETAAARL